ncbi:MAG: sulfatase-like hydrolase/transferase [Cyclobacteriaceae bacterium]
MMRFLLPCVCLMSLFCLSCEPEVKRAPNILFIFADDQRAGTIRALGNEEIQTPWLDSLVREGTSFTQAYIMGGSSPAVCAPSRAMLMTGKTLYRIPKQGRWQFHIPDSVETFPETFRKAGYLTFGTGKQHNGKEVFARGFSHGGKVMFGGMSSHYDIPIYDFDSTGLYPEEAEYNYTQKHSSELYADEAISFLQKLTPADSFLMYVSFQTPHDPREMPESFDGRYPDERVSVPANFLPEHPFDNGELKIRDEMLAPFPRTHEIVQSHLAEYYAMITHLDAQIGRILQTLHERGLSENTIIVFAGDNGLAVGQHGLLGKQNVYEHSVNVPLVFCGPGIPAGQRREAFAYLHDLYPTLCELTGLPAPVQAEGISLLQAMEDPGLLTRPDLYFAYMDFQRAVRDQRFKLIEYAVEGQRHTQLFDLQNDPLEMTNLAEEAEYQSELQRLREVLLEWKQQLGDDSPAFWSTFAADSTVAAAGF